MAEQADPMIGKILGKVKVLKKIGQGGMGFVYLGEHEILQKKVAIKVLPIHPMMEPDMRERFLREARSAANLEHSNIVQVMDIGSEENFDYFIMQFVHGQSLQDVLERTKILPIADATNLIMQTLKALSYAHKRQIIHRDIKPDNIMITREGEVKLADFGLARKMDDTSLTGSGQIMGTPNYMSPEQATADDLNQQTDIYSLGVVYYNMVTGCLPFDEPSVIAVLTAIISKPLPPPEKHNPNLPEEVSFIIKKMCAKNTRAIKNNSPPISRSQSPFAHQKKYPIFLKVSFSGKVSVEEKWIKVGAGSICLLQ